jgi:hypothetical protein
VSRIRLYESRKVVSVVSTQAVGGGSQPAIAFIKSAILIVAKLEKVSETA